MPAIAFGGSRTLVRVLAQAWLRVIWLQSVWREMGLERLSLVCGHCGSDRTPGAPWFACAQCHAVGYCSRAHQRAALPCHRGACGLPAAAPARALHAGELEVSSKDPMSPQRLVGLAEARLPPAPARPARSVEALLGAAQEVQDLVLGGLRPASGDLHCCRAACRALARAVVAHAAYELSAPWWLLDGEQTGLLAGSLALCPPQSLLHTACVCRAWRRASQDRAAWRRVQLTYGWGLDAEMRCVLRAMRRLATRHGLESMPEAPHPVAPGSLVARETRSAPCSPLCSQSFDPQPRAGAPLGGSSSPSGIPPSSRALSVAGCSPLVLRRHRIGACSGASAKTCEPPLAELWLLQPDGDQRGADSVRASLCRLLIWQRPHLLKGAAVLEVDASVGLVGLAAARFGAPRSVTVGAAGDLEGRLLRLNGTLFGDGAAGRPMCPSRPRHPVMWSGSMRRPALRVPGRAGPVPVYVYAPLPVSAEGAEDLARRWQWDSGTGMRCARPELAAPRFDLVVHAGLGATEAPGTAARGVARGLLDLAAALLADGGVLLAAAAGAAPAALAALAAEAPGACFSVVWEEALCGGAVVALQRGRRPLRH
ncbi:unnamed protein product [Prorocentrum cordatum]|uniref:MYND-type domain-containing protein n=1 Tax=Prorocentrum cordatum TaxID=2364126 RepID=A0ABN9TGA5_9DINO|nr:unnamed protein product [Polarella glacialis]